MVGGCGVGTNRADGNGVGHGGADNDGEGFAREVDVDPGAREGAVSAMIVAMQAVRS